ncbi:5381_t:CDS:1, partial [Entrophospora sp. SA101]
IISVLETIIQEVVGAVNEANKLEKRTGTMAMVAESGAVNLANTFASTLQMTLQNAVNGTFRRAT